jgi:S1-C subfamily serine protease
MYAIARILVIVAAAVAATVAIVLAVDGGGSSPAATVTVTRTAAAAPTKTLAGTQTARALEEQYVAVVRKVTPSVVQIESGGSLGSGVVFDQAGHIVTNAHVVGGARKLTVTLANGKLYQARLVGEFPADDLAVVEIDAKGLAPLPFARTSTVDVGDIVLAIGNPLGFRSSVTDGIVSALGRTVSEPNGATIVNAVQTSAPINPGNSGGALVNLAGELVGVPTIGVADPQLGRTAAGIGFAIPGDRVRDIAGQLVRNGRVVNSHKAYLGVQIGETFGGSGVYVSEVRSGGPADKAGISAGDVIVAVNGKPTPTASELATVLAGLRPGRTVEVELLRPDGSTKTARVKLGEYPGSG